MESTELSEKPIFKYKTNPYLSVLFLGIVNFFLGGLVLLNYKSIGVVFLCVPFLIYINHRVIKDYYEIQIFEKHLIHKSLFNTTTISFSEIVSLNFVLMKGGYDIEFIYLRDRNKKTLTIGLNDFYSIRIKKIFLKKGIKIKGDLRFL